jgi:hypothetical protein
MITDPSADASFVTKMFVHAAAGVGTASAERAHETTAARTAKSDAKPIGLPVRFGRRTLRSSMLLTSATLYGATSALPVGLPLVACTTPSPRPWARESRKAATVEPDRS